MFRSVGEYFSLFVGLVTIYVVIELPLRFAFSEESNLYVEIFISLVFTVDLLRNLFISQNRLQFNKQYLKSWFIIDFAAAFPFFLLPVAAYNHAFRLLRLFEFARFLKLSTFSRLIEKLQQRHLVNPSLFRLTWFLFFISLFAHWAACAWLVLQDTDYQSFNWAAYVDAIYWTLTTLTTVGYGDITPQGTNQKLFTMFMMMAGVGSYGYVIGNLASFLANLDLAKARHHERMNEISSFLKYRNIPRGLGQKVNDYFGHIWDHHLENQTSIIDELPRQLRAELGLYMHRHLISKVDLFAEAGPSMLEDIIISLKPEVIPPGAVFIREGDIGDCMYFIESGHVEVLSADLSQVYDTLGPGDFVGEMALLLNQPRSASVRAVEYCDLYRLSRDDFSRALENHPRFSKYINKVTEERLAKQKSW